jgi:hypothetical protein
MSQRLEEMDDDFKIIEEFAEGANHQYMKAHKSATPLWENCQAEIPEYLGTEYFRTKIKDHIELLDGLLVSSAKNDPFDFLTNLATLRSCMGI